VGNKGGGVFSRLSAFPVCLHSMFLWVFRRPNNRVRRRAGSRTLSFVEIHAQTFEKILMKTLRRQIWPVSGWSHLCVCPKQESPEQATDAPQPVRARAGALPCAVARSIAHKHQRHKALTIYNILTAHTIYTLCVHHVHTQHMDTYSLCMCYSYQVPCVSEVGPDMSATVVCDQVHGAQHCPVESLSRGLVSSS